MKKHGLTDKAVRETICICKERNVLKKYLEARESEAADIMVTLFSQDEVMDMYVRSERKEAAEKVINSMKKTARKMLQEGKLEPEETAEYFPNFSDADIEEIKRDLFQRV